MSAGLLFSSDPTHIRRIVILSIYLKLPENDPVQAVDVSPCGLYIAIGGQDRQVRIWSYKEAKLLRKGCLHAAEVTRVRFSPLSDYIVSTCQDGSVFKWEFPKDLASVMVSICPGKSHGKFDFQQPIRDGGRTNIAAPARIASEKKNNAILK